MIPYGRQTIEEDDIEAVAEALRGDFLTTGPKIPEFEKAICKATGAKYAVACSNGTAALHLASMALGLKEGDAVIVPSVTFLATANAVRYVGAEVIFADVDPETGLMGKKHLEDALKRAGKSKPKAVYPVHLTGQCVDLASIKDSGLKIVADACHALGGETNGKSVGACAIEDMSVFSFHPVKAIATGEGGAITTNDKALADKMTTLRSHGMIKKEDIAPWYYEMPEPGYNYRITDIQCALGISQMKKLDRFVKRRREIVEQYDELLKPLSNIVKLPQCQKHNNPAWHLYAVRIDFARSETDRATLMNNLRKKGIGTQVHYIPVHTQPYYKKRYGEIVLPGAQAYYEQTLSLPLYPAMTDTDVETVATELKKLLKG